MVCSNCGFENEIGRKFCGECGQSLSAACPSCGASNASGMKFCGECGTPLSATQAAPTTTPQTSDPLPPAGAVTERRLVSVMFADLVGFTTLSESRDSEDVRELLTRYFESSRQVI